MSTLTIEVPAKILAGIATEAKRRKLSEKQIIRERLEKPTEPTMWDLMKDLVVRDDNLPRDLSTNKKHMEGYGQSRADRQRSTRRRAT